MAKIPKLTKDKHLHALSAEQVYRIHHGMNPETGEPNPGAEVTHDECGCAHCVSHFEQNPQVLEDARARFAASPAAESAETRLSKTR